MKTPGFGFHSGWQKRRLKPTDADTDNHVLVLFRSVMTSLFLVLHHATRHCSRYQLSMSLCFYVDNIKVSILRQHKCLFWEQLHLIISSCLCSCFLPLLFFLSSIFCKESNQLSSFLLEQHKNLLKFTRHAKGPVRYIMA